MIAVDAVQQRQAMGVEHPGLGAEVMQDALGFQRQFAAVGLWPQRAIQQQDAGCGGTGLGTEDIAAQGRQEVGHQMGESPVPGGLLFDIHSIIL